MGASTNPAYWTLEELIEHIAYRSAKGAAHVDPDGIAPGDLFKIIRPGAPVRRSKQYRCNRIVLNARPDKGGKMIAVAVEFTAYQDDLFKSRIKQIRNERAKRVRKERKLPKDQ